MTKQTLCPYTGTRLSSSGATNKEHVTPVAIGAPARFFVNAHECCNSHWNDRVDAPFSNDEVVRFLAMTNSVVSRSGDVTSEHAGSVSETGDSVKVKLSGKGLDIDFAKPVVKDGSRYIVKGYGDKANEKAEEVRRNLLKKGIATISGTAKSIHNPTIASSLSLDMNVAHLQLVKSAYLYTVWCLGDAAIQSKNREQYMRALDGNGILSTNANLIKNQNGTHQFLLFVVGGKAYCEVHLFDVLKAIFVTDVTPQLDGFVKYSCIDLKAKQFTEDANSLTLLQDIAWALQPGSELPSC